MARERDVLNASLSDERVAQQFQDADLVSAAVVDDKNQLVGRITIDDVVDVIRRDAEHKLMSLAGLNHDEDIFAPIRGAAKLRAVWHGMNLLTAFLASIVVDLLQGCIRKSGREPGREKMGETVLISWVAGN